MEEAQRNNIFIPADPLPCAEQADREAVLLILVALQNLILKKVMVWITLESILQTNTSVSSLKEF